VLVVNTRSRRGAHAYQAAVELLAAQGITLDAAYPVRDPGRLQEVVRESIEAGHRLIIVGGGDGTLSSLVDALAYRDVVLGVLPIGTANSFARELGLPLSLKGAVEVIARGKVADIDLARVNQDYFVNTASLGLAISVARATPHALKKYLGRLGYLLVGSIKLLCYHSFRCRVISDGCRFDGEALQVLFANGRYYGGVLMAGNANPENRVILVQIVRGRRRRDLVRSWIAFRLRRSPDPATVTEFAVREATIETEPRQYVSIDGEIAAQTPIRLSVAPEALNVLVPETFADIDE